MSKFKITAKNAWDPFVAEGQWSRKLAAHLLSRTGFGASPEEIDQVLEKGPEDAVDWILESKESQVDVIAAERLTHSILANGDSKQLAATWVHRLLQTAAPAQEKSVLFWHGHFATGAEKVDDARLVWNQNAFLRQHAHGSFVDLVHGIAKDPAMLIYLDSESNRKSHPNENFARELMELFCLGEGKYSEADVQELARCFTGWEIKRLKFRKNRYQQDRGSKTILGQKGNFDGEDGVNVVLAQPEVAPFVVEKVIRFYVCDELAFSREFFEPLASKFRQSDYDIKQLLKTIFKSNLFYSELSIAKKIKSPVDLVIGLLRSLKVRANSKVVSEGLARVGQGLFFPPNVKGWDGGRAWINSATLLGRANLLEQLLTDQNTRFDGGSLKDYFERRDVRSSAEAVDWISKNLFALSPAPTQLLRIKNALSEQGEDEESALRSAVHLLGSLPEFQIG